jgi:hypothetical protein
MKPSDTHLSDIGHAGRNERTNCEAVDKFTGEENRVGR